MQKDFFIRQIERLRNVYSPSSLNEERVKVLWDALKDAPNEQFERAVSNLIGEFTTTTLPAVSRFQEAVANARSEGRTGGTTNIHEVPVKHDCERCRDFGFEWAEHLVVACHGCERGKTIAPAELLRHQKNYDAGRRFMGGFQPRAVSRPLPYDPKERGEIPDVRPLSPEDIKNKRREYWDDWGGNET